MLWVVLIQNAKYIHQPIWFLRLFAISICTKLVHTYKIIHSKLEFRLFVRSSVIYFCLHIKANDNGSSDNLLQYQFDEFEFYLLIAFAIPFAFRIYRLLLLSIELIAIIIMNIGRLGNISSRATSCYTYVNKYIFSFICTVFLYRHPNKFDFGPSIYCVGPKSRICAWFYSSIHLGIYYVGSRWIYSVFINYPLVCDALKWLRNAATSQFSIG